ncbi:MAG: DUF559 domain-containing protein [Clostridiales bacterium]|nr:DUF559 domain-containing protein [Clostridiales bacterium]
MGFKELNERKHLDKVTEFEDKFGSVEEYILLHYYYLGKSLKQIYDETGFSTTFIVTCMNRMNMERRGKGEANVGRGRKLSDEAKENLRKAFNSPECKMKRSISQKKAWAKLSYEERLQRTKNGNIARTINAQKASVSSIEAKIGQELDKLNIKYECQKPICDGRFVLDFYIPKFKLAIECNGDYWHNLPDRIERDKNLKRYVERKGRDIVFIWEHEINEDSEKALSKALREKGVDLDVF